MIFFLQPVFPPLHFSYLAEMWSAHQPKGQTRAKFIAVSAINGCKLGGVVRTRRNDAEHSAGDSDAYTSEDDTEVPRRRLVFGICLSQRQ